MILNDEELILIKLIAKRYTNPQIAVKLAMHPGAIALRLCKLYKKFDISSMEVQITKLLLIKKCLSLKILKIEECRKVNPCKK